AEILPRATSRPLGSHLTVFCKRSENRLICQNRSHRTPPKFIWPIVTRLQYTPCTVNMGQKLPATTINLVIAYLNDNRPVEAITNVTKASSATVYRIRLSLDLFGTPYAPRTVRQGRPARLTRFHEDELLNYLEYTPTAQLDEMQNFLLDKHEISCSISTIYRVLQRRNWSRKKTQRRAAERDNELRVAWQARLVTWEVYMLVFVDESGANERTGYRRYGWAPVGVSAVNILPIKRSERWSILPALTIKGWIDCLIIQGSITAEIFEAWLEFKVLSQCTPWPGPRLVLIMDNTSIHKSNQIQELCNAARVYQKDLPPYSPEFNPIEATFGDMKAWIKKNCKLAEQFSNFSVFYYVANQVGGQNARQHIQKAGYISRESIDELYEA
ncbi:hypothetical protein K469DRAFT_807677, partial [Zopfia rhizophila CBS 207.26]